MRAQIFTVAVAAFAIAAVSWGAGCSSTETRFTGVEPNTGTFTGGEEISLNGTNFPRSGALVRFGVKEAQSVVIESDRRIRVTTPAGDKSTNVDVTLTFDDGRSFILKNGFRFMDSSQKQTLDKFFKEKEKN